MSINSIQFKIVIHGGAGVISIDMPNDGNKYLHALKEILREAFHFAQGSDVKAIDVVEYTVTLLENCDLFNAGYGSVYTCENTHELDASIMDGETLRCGAVSLVKNVKNPIRLARGVMEKTSHNFLVGGEATSKFADIVGLEKVDESFYGTPYRLNQLKSSQNNNTVDLDHSSPSVSNDTTKTAIDTPSCHSGEKGTVGCVCMHNGHVAAATSTGGMTNKMCGRVGDSPIIGAGTYATDKAAAISCTGHGEEFMRHVAAHDVISRIDIGNMSLTEAMKHTIYKVLPTNSGGMIGVNIAGESSFQFNTEGMFRGSCD